MDVLKQNLDELKQFCSDVSHANTFPLSIIDLNDQLLTSSLDHDINLANSQRLALNVNGQWQGYLCLHTTDDVHESTQATLKSAFTSFLKNMIEAKERNNTISRYSDFLDIAADWFWETGPDNRFTFLSGKVKEILGIPPENIIGKTRTELYEDTDDLNSEHWQTHIKTVQAHKPFSNFEVTWHRPDGDKSYLNLNGTPIFDDNSAFCGYRGTAQNISERKRALNKFKSLVEGSIQGIYIHRNWNLLFANQSMANIFGYDNVSDFLQLKTVEKIIAPYESDRLTTIKQARENGKATPIRHQADYIKKDGSVITLESINIMTQWDRKPAIQSTVIDVTESKK